MKVKIIGLVAAVALVAALVAIASGATGAYFSDTHAGTVTGTLGSILVSPSGYNSDGSSANGMGIQFNNLLPGEPQTVQVNYTNTGKSPEDVYIVFPNADALHALNDLGTYGSVTIASSGGVNWVSNNLTDFYPSGTPGEPGVATLYHVPSQMLLQSNVPAGASGWMKFTFAYAAKLGNTAGGVTINGSNGVWNSYPVPTETKNGYTYTPSGTVGASNGLPYEIVATQVGQTPDVPLAHPPLSPTPSWY